VTAAEPLSADLEAGLRRLRLSAIRALAPELLVTATIQRWKPEQLLAAFVEAEIASRDRANARERMKTAAFPVTKTLDAFDVSVSSVPQATLDYLASLQWIRAADNLCLVGPAGTLYRALADNSVGKTITQILRADLILIDEIGFAPMDATGAELFFRLVAAAYERRSLGIGSHWPFEQWGKFLPEHTTAVSLLDRLLHHATIVITDGESHRMRQARHNTPRPPTR
jgi:DNA replication protein DnaC